MEIEEIVKKIENTLYEMEYLKRNVDSIEFLKEIQKDLEDVSTEPDWSECPECTDKDLELDRLEEKIEGLESDIETLENDNKNLKIAIDLSNDPTRGRGL